MAMGNELQIKYRKTSELVPYARNTRTHTEAQIAKVADSIREFGFTNPILVDGENGIIAGHCRLAAAQKLGIGSVPTIELAHLSEAQRRALVIADNKLAEDAGWDEEMLALELGALAEMEFDATLTGFGEKEIDAILQAANQVQGLTDEDEAPEVEERAVSRPGDVWLLGKHRLMCGSSTEPADVARLLADVKPHLMVTDPPYGVEYDPQWRNEAERANGKKVDARATGKVQNDDRADWREAWELFPGEVAYVWHAGIHSSTVADSLVASGFEIRSQIIWAKHRHVLSRGHYHWQHEPCWYAVRRGGGRALERRPLADHALAYRAQQERDRPRNAEAGRGDAPAHREQLQRRTGRVRSVQRLGHNHHRRRNIRPRLHGYGTGPAVRRCRGAALGSIHRARGETGTLRLDLRRGRT